ncbi:hypothetical protein ACWGII_18695 [Streptomyces sp. NPDC054855]
MAAGKSIGQVFTGDNVTQIGRLTRIDSFTARPVKPFDLGPRERRVCHLPGITDDFVGRSKELERLDEAFDETGRRVVYAVHGLGGIGKSTLAVRWACLRGADFNPIWLITADSPGGLNTGLSGLGGALQPARVDEGGEEALREGAVNWLSANDGWLLILDNVSQPDDIKWLLARVPHGRFLITTRLGATTWRGATKSLRLSELERGEAVELFTRIHDEPDDERDEELDDGIGELCGELGCLPLAVDQAAAYCREAGVSPLVYSELLARYPAKMHAATAEIGDEQRTMARVWQVTLDHLADTPTAEAILRIIAWWAPNGIPRAYLGESRFSLPLAEGIRRLAAYSMISLRRDTISVHRLVQAVARAKAPKEDTTYRDLAEKLLDAARPKGGFWGETERVWATHVETLGNHTAPESESLQLARLLIHAAVHLARSDPTRSEALYERGISATERITGVDSEESVGARGMMVVLWSAQGDWARSCRLLEKRLAADVRLWGDDHPATLSTLLQLIDVQALADPAKAEALTLTTLERATRVFGRSHPHTFRLRMRMSRLTSEDPDVGTIESRLREAASLLDEGDLEFLGLENQLLGALMKAGDFGHAVVVAEGLVRRLQADVGNTDKVTVALRMDHAILLARTGEVARARELLPAIEADSLQAMGDSPGRRHALAELAGLLDQSDG